MMKEMVRIKDIIIGIIQTQQVQMTDIMIKMEIRYEMVQNHHTYILKNGGRLFNESIRVF